MVVFSDQKMLMFDLKFMIFVQYIDDVFEIKFWGFDWDVNKKLKQLVFILLIGWCMKVFCDIYNDNKKLYDLLKVVLIKEIDCMDEKWQIVVLDFYKIIQKFGEFIDDYGYRIYCKCEEVYLNFVKGNWFEFCVY